AESNAAQVKRARLLLEGLGLDVATPAEARQILQLKGGDQVGF
ncbi:MAG: 3-keto-5-aminohexanoate cleavage protein, partial [Geminicoccaceae bacterium]